ncbi:type I restriction-modification system subunit M [Agrobacterium pusense]|uniref:type I restriction-modification system subunit M n=1 Tax=Agrobacterium TaxID=357 RepID=UPI000D3CE67C|nr:type I restriction-modification system subunit M [Agrobacterium pusense]PTV72472.1 SAM-dependent methyltransferase [Agrobacterium pusense]
MKFISLDGVQAEPLGQFFTPEHVAQSLVRWVVYDPGDRLLDPSCGDGAIVRHHPNSRGIEHDPFAALLATERAPTATIDNTDFFQWALVTKERFPCAAGNPPFIRFQKFKGKTKIAAENICAAQGVKLGSLSSTWAAFLVATASLLEVGGRMAFVVPAEIGHAPYAKPILQYLVEHFRTVNVVAVQRKLFPKLSEDCWLLHCDGFGERTTHIEFTKVSSFEPCDRPPPSGERVSWRDLEINWQGRLRPFLISRDCRALYQEYSLRSGTERFGDFAKISIGYITGDNDFFHLSPTSARSFGIPSEYLLPTVRRGEYLQTDAVKDSTIKEWMINDEQYLLLCLSAGPVPDSVVKYLDSDRGLIARARYKCRTRAAWYSVPGVIRPDYFLQYMSGAEVRLARNEAGAVCTNSILAVNIINPASATLRLPSWGSDFVKLSCELEGHPLGGGMLKLEPGEARRVVFPTHHSTENRGIIQEAVRALREWRHTKS